MAPVPRDRDPNRWATLFAARDSRVYRADVTTSGLVIGPGITTLTVSDLSFEAGVPGSNDGVGALVIIDDGINPSSVVVRDGSDWAYDPTNGDPGPINPALRETVPQTFTFAASAVERTAQVNLFFASVQDTTLRPSPWSSRQWPRGWHVGPQQCPPEQQRSRMGYL